jgi:hypothetical protein
MKKFNKDVPNGVVDRNDAFGLRESVVKVVLYIILTVGIYYPIWFLRKKERVNALSKSNKLGSFIPIMVIFLTCINFFLWFFAGCYSQYVEITNMYQGHLTTIKFISLIFEVLLIFFEILLVIYAFMIRKILLSNFNDNLRISILLTFFLGAIYLQYKINELSKA